jgi:hypothetical protein
VINVDAHIPWWAWTVPLWPTVLAMTFTLATGWLRGRATGQYPTVQEWTQALLALLHPVRAGAAPETTSRPAALPQQAGPDEIEPDNEQSPNSTLSIS